MSIRNRWVLGSARVLWEGFAVLLAASPALVYWYFGFEMAVVAGLGLAIYLLLGIMEQVVKNRHV